MRLYHITNRRYVRQLLRQGLQPSRARGRRKVVWLCSRQQVRRVSSHLIALGHVRHGSRVVLTVNVPRSTLVRWRRGIYWSYLPVPLDR